MTSGAQRARRLRGQERIEQERTLTGALATNRRQCANYPAADVRADASAYSSGWRGRQFVEDSDVRG
jgi:hypothetical protein